MQTHLFLCTLSGLVVGLGGAAATTLAQRTAQPDIFAQTAAIRQDYDNRSLVSHEPPTLPFRDLPMEPGDGAAFEPADKLSTPEQLKAELARAREAHRPFLQDLAPAVESPRIRVPLEYFDWRQETVEDRQNFAGTLAGAGRWQSVRIPHYAGPMGRATTYYRTNFDVTPGMISLGSLFVCFRGVDYKAHVFVNGAYLGSHEGIFAPFEFDMTPHVRQGPNTLLVKVENDFTMIGNSVETGFLSGAQFKGDKIYAAVGPCWDEPGSGWHCCPPGMGIYQDVAIEARRRIHLHDIFVRPLLEDHRAEAWIEVNHCDYPPQAVLLQLSLYGQNFQEKVFENRTYAPPDIDPPNMSIDERIDLVLEQGVSLFKIPISIPLPRQWSPASPWLYQLQVRVLDTDGRLLDAGRRQFGMRSFRMEYLEEPRGRMFLNGVGIRLRGANTMGALQRCVIEKNWDQLIDDILLAKITHMNFMRLTQMPVQSEIYEYCDRLGLMLQTDLPLFGVLRRNQFCEAVRQAGEMERLVRAHPSNIMVTYINEPYPDAGGRPQRNLTREELTRFFEAADIVVRLANPDRVIKAIDGDYDPPGPGLPDNHCYTGWYNGHGVEMGALHKGYWMPVKPGWFYGCGEFGAEGLDFAELMRRRYPASWLPQTEAEEKQWTPDSIPGAQTGHLYASFFERPDSLAGWVERGQAHQAWATRIMTEAFRRNNRMHSFAIHLFIDAYPASWMKAIMDCERRPKPAWYVYRDALTPLAVNLRWDRRSFYPGQPVAVEAWVCNDRAEAPAEAMLRYQVEAGGRVLHSGMTSARIVPLAAEYQGSIRFDAPPVVSRGVVTVRLGLLDGRGEVLHDTALQLDILPRENLRLPRLYLPGPPGGRAERLAKQLEGQVVREGPIATDDAVLIDDITAFESRKDEITAAVRSGARAIFLELPPGVHAIGGGEVSVNSSSPTELHFVARDTGHELVQGFGPEDFKFWYDAGVDRPSPLLRAHTFTAEGFAPILTSHDAIAVGVKADGQGAWYVCQIALADRVTGNATADIFARRMLAR